MNRLGFTNTSPSSWQTLVDSIRAKAEAALDSARGQIPGIPTWIKVSEFARSHQRELAIAAIVIVALVVLKRQR